MSGGVAGAGNAPAEEPGSYAGWYIGLAVCVIVIAIGVGLWFAYHP